MVFRTISNKVSAESKISDTKPNQTLTPEPSIKDTPADFETAMDVAGCGIFHILLIICALPAAIATVVETSTMSYILPSAECDLKLTLLDKGLLNAITFAGMISSAILWGYIADTKGRKKVLVFGYLTNIISILGGACSQNVFQLMLFKYISGFIMCGPYAVIMSYLTELHGKKQRSRVIMYVGVMFSVGNIALPVLALAILPSQGNFQILGLQFHSWQVFLAFTTIPCLIGGTLLSFFPESPKFLMSQGRNAEALKVFQTIYAINKRKSCEEYPIKELENEQLSADNASDSSTVSIATIEKALSQAKVSTVSKSPTEGEEPKVGFRHGLQQLRPLLSKQYLGLSAFVYLMSFAILFGQNTLRLWMPQLFAFIEEYEQIYGNKDSTMCAILEYSVNKTPNHITELSKIAKCEVVITAASYTNNITVAVASFVGYLLAGVVVNHIGSKILLTIGSIGAGLCAVGLYFSVSAFNTLIISSISLTMGSVAALSTLSCTVDLFPTSLRTMIVSLAMMFGRMGTILGNILFPVLISLGCVQPFTAIAFVMFSAGIMSVFLPNTRKMVLK